MPENNYIFSSFYYQNLLYFIFFQFLIWVNGEFCPENTDTVAKLLSASGIATHRKSCPDFKDEVNQSFCCPSSITPGTFYCCTEEKREEIDALLAAEARKIFFRNHLAHIIIGSILSLVFIIVVTSVICKRVKYCPMYHKKSLNTPSSQILSSYRPVDTLPPKPPTVYEAPPPYEFSTTNSNQFTNIQQEHDWNCLIENEINDARIYERGP
jgi:hypothetical protein